MYSVVIYGLVFFLSIMNLYFIDGFHLHYCHIAYSSRIRITVYETLRPKQMLVHKGDQIDNVQLITGVVNVRLRC